MKPIRKLVWIAVIISTMRFFPGEAFAQTYSYDSTARLAQVSYADGSVVNYAYDVSGNLTGITASTTQAPVIASQPQSTDLAAGGNATLTVTVSGAGPFTYQWQLNGSAIPGATSAQYVAEEAGRYSVVVSGPNGSTTSSVATVTSSSTPGAARLINISTRAQVGTGGNILIPGFVIGGSGMETLLIRADGPSLTVFGVSGVLAQPSLQVTNSAGTVVASNTGWGNNSNPTLISTTAASVGAFALPAGSADCAAIVSLAPGAYTVQVSGVGNTTGVALAEVYEVSSNGTRLINISTRAQVGTGSDLLIPGFVIAGNGTENLLVRADGPGLVQFGVMGVLAQPSLSVTNNSGTAVAANTVWDNNPNSSEIASIAASVGAFPFVSGSADSAAIVSLQAGAYTMQVSGVDDTIGVALAEVYEVPSN